MISYFILIFVINIGLVLCFNETCQLKIKENVLFVIIDDLRLAEISLPNVKKLAQGGAYFKNSYCQQALCAPSRNSLLTGRRPDSLQTYDFFTYWRDKNNFSTIPQFFKENGFRSYSIGKVFHPGKSSNFSDDYPLSWAEIPFHPPAEKYKNWHVCKDRETKKMQRNLICPISVKSQPDETLPDIQTLNYTINMLKKHKRSGEKFFIVVGLHKPHIPLKYPKEFRSKVDASRIRAPSSPHLPRGAPRAALHPWSDVRGREDIARLNISFPLGTMPARWTRKIKRNYYAASLYIDSLLGELLAHVDRSDTLVVLTSDHGWSLGENGLWAKYSNFDVALKVPLIISAPGIVPKVYKTPVELIDIFPTLVQLTGIPIDKNRSDLHFEGKSLVPIMCGDDTTEYPAFSQYPRPSEQPQHNSDKPKLNEIKIMGYTVVYKKYRYTDWVAFDPHHFTRNWSRSYGKELYDHKSDPYESKNLIADPQYAGVAEELSMMLRKKVERQTD